MRGLLYEENSFWVFMLLTVSLGGAAALMTGRAIAAAWRPWWHVIPLMLLLGAAVRFLHFALFGGTLLSLTYYVADTAVCLVVRPDRVPADAGGADGQLLRLDQRARGVLHLAAAQARCPAAPSVRIRMTIAGFAG